MIDQKIDEACEYVCRKIEVKPRVSFVLGSGLSRVADLLEGRRDIAFTDIPHFPAPTVPGHPGRLVVGRLHGIDVVVMQGRLHYYEGYSTSEISMPVYLLGRLGVSMLVETCTAGGLSVGFSPGDLALIVDHVNLMGANPLFGRTVGERFINMENAYSPRLRCVMKDAAEEAGIALKEAVYVAVAGPTYETPAETRFLGGVADIVGMSLVPEVIVARSLDMEVAAVGIVTNAHNANDTVTHDEVLAVAGKAERKVEALLKSFLEKIASKGEK